MWEGIVRETIEFKAMQFKKILGLKIKNIRTCHLSFLMPVY